MLQRRRPLVVPTVVFTIGGVAALAGGSTAGGVLLLVMAGLTLVLSVYWGRLLRRR